MTDIASSLRCAEWARAVGVEPLGTAGSYPGFLLVEWPLPWPADAGDIPELSGMAPKGVRLQLIVPRGGPQVRLYRTEGEWFSRYTCEDDDAPEVEVLVCTHGRRDRCCGSMGTALAAELDGVVRTSHTGGHRFAPTAVVLPYGTAWAFLDADALRRIRDRSGPLDDLLSRYRGCAGLPSSRAQVVERHAFAEIGWDWLDWERRAVDLPDGRTRLEGRSPRGEEAAWEAHVERAGTTPVPRCGEPLGDDVKTQPVYAARGVARIA